MPNKSKFATVILSFIPGVGHMYLGWLQRGLMFMLTFCLAIFITGWTNISFFGLFIPVIWFYGLFDALQCYDGAPPEASRAYRHEDWHWLIQKQRWIGITLILVGALIFVNRLAYPALVQLLGYQRIEMIKILLVALLLILGGIRLAWGKSISRPDEPSPPVNRRETEKIYETPQTVDPSLKTGGTGEHAKCSESASEEE